MDWQVYFWMFAYAWMYAWLPYNGIFSRRQISAVLSQKHDDYFSQILIFAVGNVREKIISVLFRENDRGGDITRLSLDRSTVRKENLRPKYLKRKGIKAVWQTQNIKQKEHINIQMVEWNYCSEQNNEMPVFYLNSESCVIRQFLP